MQLLDFAGARLELRPQVRDIGAEIRDLIPQSRRLRGLRGWTRHFRGALCGDRLDGVDRDSEAARWGVVRGTAGPLAAALLPAYAAGAISNHLEQGPRTGTRDAQMVGDKFHAGTDLARAASSLSAAGTGRLQLRGKRTRPGVASRLPTGTVTFLLSDVEDSAALWEEHPEQMRRALARHDELIEALVRQHDGVVVRPRGEGDSRFAVFTRPTDAVGAACAIQLALHTEPWPLPSPLWVRLAVHTGETDMRDGDYYGSAVNRCGRLRALAYGGQTLVSELTARLVGQALPPETGLRELGTYLLRGFELPERVFQLTHARLPSTFPPLRAPLRRRDMGLPVALTSFVGRDTELALVQDLLGTARLVTLTGPGGSGKTRLAVELARAVGGRFTDGVTFVDLAPISDPVLVASAVAAPLGVREAGGQPVQAGLRAALREQHRLVVLDNFEHVISAAPLITELLMACPNLTILVTSRTRLHLSGEQEFVVPPLPVPDTLDPPVADALMSCPSVALFVMRARAVRTNFDLTLGNARAVTEICRRLDGLPLAIELAAAHAKLLPPEALLARFNDQLGLLVGGARDLPARQQTLRGTLEWSHGLLGVSEQTLFRRLAVFVGGGTLEAAEHVCTPPTDLPINVLQGLQVLVDSSLVRPDAQPDGQPRVGMLETIRAYARERLELSGEAAMVRHRHLRFFLGIAEAAEPQLQGPDQVAWLDRLERDHDNLRAALRWAVDSTDHEMALRLGSALGRFWLLRGYLSEGDRWLAEVLEWASAAPIDLQAKVLNAAGNIAGLRGDAERASSLHERALALRRTSGNQAGICQSLHNLGAVAALRGNLALARERYSESLLLRRELGDQRGIAVTLLGLGDVTRTMGDFDAANALLQEGLGLFRTLRDTWGVAMALLTLGLVARELAETDHAVRLVRESLAMFRDLGDKSHSALSLEALAGLIAVRAEPRRAAKIFGAAAALREAIGAPAEPHNRARCEQDVRALCAQLGSAVYTAAWEEGHALSPESAIAEALATTAGRPG